MKKVKLVKDFYGERNIQLKSSFELEDNSINCLVGCNGSGKSTFIKNLKYYLVDKVKEVNKIALGYDLHNFPIKANKEENKDLYIEIDRNTNPKENITQLMDFDINDVHRKFMSTGENFIDRIATAFGYLKQIIKQNKGKSLYFVLDDIDVGLSIDTLESLKRVLDLVCRDCKENNITYYIFLAVNSYYFTRFYKCIDVNNLKYVKFETYEAYEKFVLKSAELKNKLIAEAAKNRRNLNS